MPLKPRDKSEGFTLIEFLVALLVFAIGILALTSLQIFVLRSDISAHHQAQAVQIAYSMMDRLRSNRSAAMAGSYNIPNAAAISAGNGNPPLADDDLADWNANELSLLPNADAIINCTTSGNCTITISWSDAQGDPNVPTPTTTLSGNI